MPLAIGYIKAAMDAHPVLGDACDTEIVNLRGGMTIGDTIAEVFRDGIPDVLAISVFGWSFRSALLLSETFKQLNSSGLVVLGGTHVANQAKRVFRLSDDIDVIANGEGELVFPELLEAWIENKFPLPSGEAIRGISYRLPDGGIKTTPERPRIEDLGSIVSPFLSGAIPMTHANGKFRYDVALMETNRGCPYHCAFCYWGGAIGQKMRRFPRERLLEELEMFAFYEVHSVVLCDSNFGMQPQDEEFLEDVVRLKERTGYPRAIESSWAKNKSATFYRIVTKMREAGLHSSFTIALQTLDASALEEMNRRNMKLNDWKALAEWLSSEGLECYAELLWGAPGDTTETFLRGYDELSLHVPRIATYPLMLLPNTDYSARREQLGFVTSRGDADDFEYVLASKTMTLQENLEMQGFLLWARSVAENSFFRYIWRPALAYAGLTQSQILFSLAEWFDASDEEASTPLKSPRTIVEPAAVNAAVRALFLDKRVREMLETWWQTKITPLAKAEKQWILNEVFRFDMLTLPILNDERASLPNPPAPEDESYRRDEKLKVDVPNVVRALRNNDEVRTEYLRPAAYSLRWRLGIEKYVDNHEEALLHVAQLEKI
ncbi:radical SAM protein [Rhodococcus sp. P1Y]|nr:radical SAM protein [Rhodococcus sp. P1Y]